MLSVQVSIVQTERALINS